jgi:hypothetical protein
LNVKIETEPTGSSVRPEDETHRIARIKGYSVKYPAANELFVDIDDEESLKVFERGLKALKNFYPHDLVQVVRRTASPSGKPHHLHIVIRIGVLESELPRDKKPTAKIFTNEERLAYQLLLGSDPKREILGFAHIKAGEERPTRFFEKKGGSKARKRAEIAMKEEAVKMLENSREREAAE